MIPTFHLYHHAKIKAFVRSKATFGIQADFAWMIPSLLSTPFVQVHRLVADKFSGSLGRLMAKRYLTKSRFKIGYECPTKLYYLDNKSYGSTMIDNPFLEALAEGGFQIGELAKLYHPGGIEITAVDKDEAVRQTMELLKQEDATIYEAAIRHGNLFVKVDVLVKKGNHVDLIEVKAKSFDPSEENPFYTKSSMKAGKTPQIASNWEPYLVDIAFQTYVFEKAHPEFTISSHLMLADKSAVATVDGLNQRFFLERSEGGKTSVRLAHGTNAGSIGQPILRKVSVDEPVEVVWNMEFADERSFEDLVAELSRICEKSEFHPPEVGSHCKSCEFRIDSDLKRKGLKSGFEHCWTKAHKLRPEDFSRPFVFDIWNFRKADKLLQAGKIFMDELSEEDVAPKADSEGGLSNSQRQWLQVEKVKEDSEEPFFDMAGLRREMSTWAFPLHFIDFETTMVAIPFHKGRRPYEQIAFQFSHHKMEKDGRITHENQYLNRTKGHFPNFDFVRALKDALSREAGTIFRYAAHENTVLCQIREQLLNADQKLVPDRKDLIQFIESITESTGASEREWHGPRAMVDMCELVKKYFYHPLTQGSNSIKKVLPAVLSQSDHLQDRYSRPIYGTSEIPSLNYKQWAWLQADKEGRVLDPYKLLPPIFTDLDLEEMDALLTKGSIADGGAAMTAYTRMQFTEMSEAECERVASSLLKYCELDTFAMVMICEYWMDEIKKYGKSGRAA